MVRSLIITLQEVQEVQFDNVKFTLPRVLLFVAGSSLPMVLFFVTASAAAG